MATADPGSTFTGWSGGGCSGTSNCVVTLNSDTAVTATFTTNPPPPPKPCVVPNVKGKKLVAAKSAIRSHHCSVGKVTKVTSSPKHKGRVVSQSPKPGRHLRHGAKVSLKVGK
jgi:beta-lactam-binding protein with PASTA domain